MKRLLLFILALGFTINAHAQLAGTKRETSNVWMSGDRKISFGPNPDASIKYDTATGNLVIDVVGGGKVSFPDGLDAGAGSGSFGASVIFEGATADAFETTLTVVDPTADRTISIPNASGTLFFSTSAQDAANSIKGIANGIEFEGSTADGFETQVTATDPTGDNTITFPDASGVPILSVGVPGDAGAVWGNGSSRFVFEGATADGFETTLIAADPGADATVTLPAVTGTMCIGGALVATAGANTACNTTCGAGKCCGAQDTDAAGALVGCAAATADICSCMP